jgi:hypothetical protein
VLVLVINEDEFGPAVPEDVLNLVWFQASIDGAAHRSRGEDALVGI